MEGKQIGKHLGAKSQAILEALQDAEASYETVAARTGSTARS
ncbi:MAG: hypothetical protein OEY99_06885 [Aigarchaeota archaeon]|nr:hypothetical protein [Aigarchaeota archaeon]